MPGRDPVRIDNDYAAQENNQWQNFGLTADGTIYHVRGYGRDAPGRNDVARRLAAHGRGLEGDRSLS